MFSICLLIKASRFIAGCRKMMNMLVLLFLKITLSSMLNHQKSPKELQQKPCEVVILQASPKFLCFRSWLCWKNAGKVVSKSYGSCHGMRMERWTFSLWRRQNVDFFCRFLGSMVGGDTNELGAMLVGQPISYWWWKMLKCKMHWAWWIRMNCAHAFFWYELIWLLLPTCLAAAFLSGERYHVWDGHNCHRWTTERRKPQRPKDLVNGHDVPFRELT